MAPVCTLSHKKLQVQEPNPLAGGILLWLLVALQRAGTGKICALHALGTRELMLNTRSYPLDQWVLTCPSPYLPQHRGQQALPQDHRDKAPKDFGSGVGFLNVKVKEHVSNIVVYMCACVCVAGGGVVLS